MLVLGFSGALATGIPFFSDFQSLLGALTGTPSIFGWPPLFFLCGAAARGQRVARVDRLLCLCFMCVLMPVLGLMGVANGVGAIMSHWKHHAHALP